MSEQAPEATPQQAQQRQPSSPFLRKLGPLPLWAWMAVGLGVALAYYMWQKNKAAASASTTSSNTAGSTGAATTTASGTPSDLIPQFVNQVYNQTSPPNVTVNNATTNNVPAPTPTPVATPPPKAQPGYPAPSDFEANKTGGTSVRIHWNAVLPTPTGYTWVIHDAQGNQKEGSTTGTNVNVSGLKKNTGYSIGVWANEGNGHAMGDQTWGYVQT